MHRTAIHRRLTCIIIFLLYGTVSFATGGDSTSKPGELLPFNGIFAGYTQKAVNKNIVANATSRSFEQLDQYIAGEQFSFQKETEFTEQYFENINTGNTTIEEYKAKARAVLSEVQNGNSYIDYLEPSDINKLPIGLRKKVGNSEITIAVSSAVFTDKYAKLTAFARVKIPQAPYELLFGISDLKLSYKGGIIGDASLVLLGDVAIPINGDKAALILKGGIDMQTGQSASKTFITVDCKGFKQLGLNADILFSRNMIVPSDAAGVQGDGRVTAELRNVLVSNWNDIIATVNFKTPFQVNGLKGFNFTVTTAAFDLSDIKNNPDVVYPQGYQQKYLVADNLTAWRGVYVQELSVGLPAAIKNRENPNEIVKFSVNGLIIDNNGITGVFYGENVLPITKGTASGWKFSLDSIRLAFEANSLIRAGFGGKVGLPVNKGDDGNNKRKFLAYSAVISANSEYVLRVNTLDEMDFDVWKAKVFLQPNSWVQITGNSTSFKPEAMLHGKMGIVAATTDENPNRDASKAPVADFQGITFRSLHLTTTAPYIDAEYFGYEGEVRLGNFPVSIYNIAMVKDTAAHEVGIGLGLKVNLHEQEFSGNASFTILGKLEEGQGLTSWRYSKLKIGEIAINAKIKEVIRLEGRVKFLDDHPIYGDGFDGHIRAVIEKGFPDTVSVEVNATFGKTTFRYWYVDGLADLGTGIGGAVKIQGFGGGAYYRMKKDGFSTSFSATGARYVPDETAGLGLKAAVIFSVGSKKLVKGEASFEIAFNKGGGVRYIGLFGYAKFMGDIPGLDNVTDFAKKKFKDVEEKLNTLNVDALNNMKIMQPSNAAKEAYPTEERPGQTGLAAYIGIQYDFDAKSLHATFDMYVNAAGGMITGAASENRAGWAVFHVDPKEWYLHIGTPTDRLGLKIGIGPINVRTGSYLMAGYRIPAFPDPPSRVINILRDAGLEYKNNISGGDLEGGRGFAFGTSLEVSTGDVRFLFFYANFAAGLGFDVMIKDWGNAHCELSSEPIGINGWYAQGQAYAYLQGELGVKIKILFIKKNISIIKGGAAALLQAKLPNPTWVGGYMGFKVDILGGLIKGRFNFKFSFGKDCKVVDDDGIKEFDDFTVVSNITPDDQETNVSVLASPAVKFNIQPGKTMEAPREDGSGTDVFMPVLESFKLYEGDNEVPGKASFSVAGDVLTMVPDAVMKENTSYRAVTRVTIRQLVNGYWVPLSENGHAVEELKQVTFTTGAVPDTLPHSLIQHMFPFFGMRNLYKDESNKGVVKLRSIFEGFFSKFAVWKMRVEDLSGNLIATTSVTHNGQDLYNYNVPAGLQPNTTYRMRLMGEQPLKPGADPAKPQLNFTFTTSRYNTLAAKMQSINVTKSVINRVSSDVIDLQAEVAPYEGFELYEVAGVPYTRDRATIEGESDITNEAYFQNVLKQIIPLYNGNTQFQLETAEAATYGAPPLKAITPLWYYIATLQSNAYDDLLKTRMPFIHNTNKYYNLQFLDLRKQVIRAYLNPGYGVILDQSNFNSVPEAYRKLCAEAFPFMLKGKYKVQFRLVQLDDSKSAPSEFSYENSIE
jgi:hypothetical protein